MTDSVQEIKERLDIVEFLRGYFPLKQAGKNFKANCPFHQEKTPSFIISPDRQIWHCFGCGLGGDVFKFLMTYENIEFYEALKILAEKAGVELKNLSSQDYRQFGVLYEINEVTKDFYYKQLVKSQNVKSYLSKRGLHEATIEDFEIGYAPNDFDATSTHLLKSGYTIDDILRAGRTWFPKSWMPKPQLVITGESWTVIPPRTRAQVRSGSVRARMDRGS